MTPRLKLVFLALLFSAPLTIAALLYFVFPEFIPGGRLNYGTLIEPARPLPQIALHDAGGLAVPDTVLKGKWSLVYLGGPQCDAACQQRLLLTRQVRLALDQKRKRVQRVYLAPDAATLADAQRELAAQHPDLLFLVGDASGIAAFFQPSDPQDLFLLDPLANWLMIYTGEIKAKGLHRDLKKLLHFSQIG